MGNTKDAWEVLRERLEPSTASGDFDRTLQLRGAAIWRHAAGLALGLGALFATGGLAGAAPIAPATSNPAASGAAPTASGSATLPAPTPSAAAAPSGSAAQPAPSATEYPPGYGPPPAGSGYPPGYGPPPAGAGYPPGYGAPPQGAGYPPGYVPPPAGYGYPPAPYGYYPAPPPEPPETLPYEEGQQIPQGYAVENKRLVGLAIAGGATFGAIWLVSLAAGVALENDAREQEEEYNERSTDYFYYEDTGLGVVDRHDVVWPLALPIVGPFITLGTAHAEGPGIAILMLDGVIQAGGLAMLIAGLAVENEVLVLQVGGDSAVQLTPTLGPSGAGFGIRADM